jgi:hypothetical protein
VLLKAQDDREHLLSRQNRYCELQRDPMAEVAKRLTDGTRSALLGNAKTLCGFRCNPGDASILSRSFHRLHEEFNPTALLELDDGEAIVAAGGRDAMRVNVPPPAPVGSSDAVKKQSRRHCGRPRAEVERCLARQLGYR